MQKKVGKNNYAENVIKRNSKKQSIMPVVLKIFLIYLNKSAEV